MNARKRSLLPAVLQRQTLAEGDYRTVERWAQTHEKRLEEVDGWRREFSEDPRYGGNHLQTTVSAARKGG